jgi:pyruvate,water dikinase
MQAVVAERHEAALPFVVPLALAHDGRSVGGKALNLARMTGLGLSVPPAIVVTRAAFETFLAVNQLDRLIDARCRDLDPADPAGITRAARSICRLVIRASLPESVTRETEPLCHELLQGGPLIVRSSAVGEDSGSASFAGQLDSFPDIHTWEQLHSAVLACWASYWSERALFYRLSRGARLDGMGVVIQRQVHPGTSGVLFTEAPLSDGKTMLVECCAGSCESLVSGRITPTRLWICRRSLRWWDQPDSESSSTAALPVQDLLAPGEVERLARTALRLERELGCPQDVEWVIDGQRHLHLVQSRPITTPPSTTDRAPRSSFGDGAPKVVWSNANVNENFPEPISPFLYSIASTGYYHYFRNLALAFGISRPCIRQMDRPLRGIIGVQGGRMYYNLTNIHAVLRMAPCGEALAEFFNRFVGADLDPSMHRGVHPSKKKPRGRMARLAELSIIFVSTVRQYLFLSRRVALFERTVTEFGERTHPDRLAQRTPTELLDDLSGFLDIRNNRWMGAALADTAAMVCHGLLERLLRSASFSPGRAALHNTLLRGLPDLVSAVPAVELWALSRRVRRDPELARLFASRSGEEILEQIQDGDRFAEFREELDRFLEQWGFRFSGELMLTLPSYQEDPAALIELLKSYVGVEGESPSELMRRQAHERERETQWALSEFKRVRPLPYLPSRLQGRLLRLVLSWTQRSVALRERARLKQALLYSRCRRIALAIGGELVRDGRLTSPDDVFFLTVGELERLVSERAMFPHDTTELVKLRRARHAHWCSLNPPATLELDHGEYLDNDPAQRPLLASDEPRDTAAELSGVGACGGRVRARAALVRDLTESHLLSPGDVLVTRQTDPGWGPLFFLAGGLVLERGGMLSHGAILAREYGIPCVVAVAGATERIAPGGTVTVDGDLGTVRLGE